MAINSSRKSHSGNAISPRLLIVAMCAAEILGMAAFAAFPALLPRLRETWAMSNTAAGWVSGMYFAGYLVAVGVLMPLTDRRDPRRIYLACMGLSALAALGFAFMAAGAASASLWSFLQGVGLAGTYMPGLKALADLMPERWQSRAVAFYTACFGVGASLSFLLSGWFEAHYHWRAVFALCALGPVGALALAAFALPARRSTPGQAARAAYDFQSVFANRRALVYTLAYSAHSAELFALRSWIVAFLVFCQGRHPQDFSGGLWGATTIAALVNLIGVPASIVTNEVAGRFGRRATLVTVMAASAVVAVAFGCSSQAPFVVTLSLALLYGVTVSADSATLTAGLVAVADPARRGATLALYSMIGFTGAFFGPVLFGAVLDLAGGGAQPFHWGWAFFALAAVIATGALTIARGLPSG